MIASISDKIKTIIELMDENDRTPKKYVRPLLDSIAYELKDWQKKHDAILVKMTAVALLCNQHKAGKLATKDFIERINDLCKQS